MMNPPLTVTPMTSMRRRNGRMISVGE
jgi:hypothetical protein